MHRPGRSSVQPHIFHRDLAMKSFLRPDSSKVVVSYWQKHGHLVLVNCLGSLPRNSVGRLTDQLAMALIVLTGPYNLNTNKHS